MTLLTVVANVYKYVEHHGADRLVALARVPPQSLKYIVVHEMAHLAEPVHGGRLVDLLERVIAGWQHRRDQLNQLPVAHEGWNA